MLVNDRVKHPFLVIKHLQKRKAESNNRNSSNGQDKSAEHNNEDVFYIRQARLIVKLIQANPRSSTNAVKEITSGCLATTLCFIERNGAMELQLENVNTISQLRRDMCHRLFTRTSELVQGDSRKLYTTCKQQRCVPLMGKL